MSSGQEPIDLRRGRTPLVTESGSTMTFELSILGGAMRDELFVPTARTRLVIRCQRDGEITLRILNGRSSGV